MACLAAIRARRHEFEQDIPEVFNILKKGSKFVTLLNEVGNPDQALDELFEALKH